MTLSAAPIPSVLCKNLELIGHRAVLYRPVVETDAAIRPLVFYMHGGGFILGSADDTDFVTRKLCSDNNATVISLDYPLAPQSPYPAALEYSLSVIAMAEQIASAENFAYTHIVIAGDSAGGNLAMASALECRRLGRPAAALVLFAPWLDINVKDSPDAPFLRKARDAYAPEEGQWNDPLVSPFYCEAKDLPPTFFAVGSADTLAVQTKDFFLRPCNVGLRHLHMLVYPKLPHGFYTSPTAYAETLDCFERVSKFLRTTLGGRDE